MKLILSYLDIILDPLLHNLGFATICTVGVEIGFDSIWDWV